MKHWAYCRSNHGTESGEEGGGGGQSLHAQPNFDPSRRRAAPGAHSPNDCNGFLRRWWNRPYQCALVGHTVTLLRELLRDSRV